MEENKITLEGFLRVVKSGTNPITINLSAKGEEENTSLITFILPGYDHLDDDLLADEVVEIEIVKLNVFNVVIDKQ